MSSNYPGTLDSFTNPAPTDYEDVVSHSGQHSNANDAIEAIEGVLGTTAGSALFANYGTADKPVKANSAGTLTQPLGLGTLTSGTVSITSIIDDDTMATASATTLATSESTKAYVDNGTWLKDSMARQAIINGNFDVWQRGTSLVVPAGVNSFLADRWKCYVDASGGTLPTLTQSRQIITSGALDNSFYHWRLNTNGAGTSLGANSQFIFYQQIEHGVRNLCGLNKKVTLSFWAKSDIANKKIGYSLFQSYGSGGSPSAGETITGTSVTLTSTWTKYTQTFTTNTLVGKTFGTANDDSIWVDMYLQWGSTIGTANGFGSAETYVGSGNIDIAQVQLCAGDVALPFMPKSFEEELRACMRYCYNPFYLDNKTYSLIGLGYGVTTTIGKAIVNLPQATRVGGSLTWSGNLRFDNSVDSAPSVTSLSINSASSGLTFIVLDVGVASGIQAKVPFKLERNNDTSSVFLITAEL